MLDLLKIVQNRCIWIEIILWNSVILINNHILNKETFLPVVIKGWEALYNAVDKDGKICWGQGVSRDPGKVDKEDSAEFVSGAFLLAGSEMYKLVNSYEE